MKKHYPKRKDLVSICECGHSIYIHGGAIFTFKSPCYKCMCPNFKLDES